MDIDAYNAGLDRAAAIVQEAAIADIGDGTATALTPVLQAINEKIEAEKKTAPAS
jgi:hypothetical protein